MPIFCVNSVKINTGQKKFTRIYPWDPWQISGMNKHNKDKPAADILLHTPISHVQSHFGQPPILHGGWKTLHCRISSILRKQVQIYKVLFICSSPFSVPKWKKLAQPTKSFFTLKISWKSSPGWLQLVFHFGTENWEEQLKKAPCIYTTYWRRMPYIEGKSSEIVRLRHQITFCWCFGLIRVTRTEKCLLVYNNISTILVPEACSFSAFLPAWRWTSASASAWVGAGLLVQSFEVEVV